MHNWACMHARAGAEPQPIRMPWPPTQPIYRFVQVLLSIDAKALSIEAKLSDRTDKPICGSIPSKPYWIVRHLPVFPGIQGNFPGIQDLKPSEIFFRCLPSLACQHIIIKVMSVGTVAMAQPQKQHSRALAFHRHMACRHVTASIYVCLIKNHRGDFFQKL